jgi:hypothetical protein
VLFSARGAGPANPANEEALAAVKTTDDSAKLPFGLARSWLRRRRGRRIRTTRRSISTCRSARISRRCWPGAVNAPLAFIDQHIQNLRQHRAIAVDVGDQDNLKIDTSKLHDVLTNYGITHDFEIYLLHTRAMSRSVSRARDAIFSRTLSFNAKR